MIINPHNVLQPIDINFLHKKTNSITMSLSIRAQRKLKNNKNKKLLGGIAIGTLVGGFIAMFKKYISSPELS